MADPLTQEKRRLKIDTVRNGKDTDDKTVQVDPFLCLSVEGTEEFSKSFSYSVKLWRSPVKKPFLRADDLMKLVNTPVTLTCRLSVFTEEGAFFQPGGVGQNFKHDDDDPRTKVIHIERSGVFEDFKDEGFVHNEEGTAPNAFFQYSATIVPAFKMMQYEKIFRVFENKTVIEIITDVAKTQKFPFLNIDFDPSIGRSAFPKMPYCVQYQETTYNFLSRLMNRFGIWYYFDHNRNLQGNPPHESTMVIGTDFPKFPSCRNNITSGENLGALVALDKMVTTLREPSPTTIRDFGGLFHPAAERFLKDGDFNPLDPASPYEGEATISPSRDLLKHDDKTPAKEDRYRREEFQIPSVTNTESTRYAEHQLEAAAPLVATFHGSTRNPAFIPGFTFDIVGDETVDVGNNKILAPDHNEIAGKSDVVVFAGGAISGGEGGGSGNNLLFVPSGKAAGHLLTFVKFGSTVVEYLNQLGFLEKLKASIFPKGTSALDAMANFTNSGLNNYLQNQLPLNLGQPVGGPLPYVLPFILGGGLAGVASLIPLVVKLLEDDDPESEFHCSFNAISLAPLPLGDDSLSRAPLPTDWVKPVARGPHLAVVIGPDGTDTKKGELFADPLGRIRVRFPWDRRPKEDPGDQFKRGDNTCWVRVSDGWAGRRFGIQFLPRIGHEVIVDFLDGDPDRPIVTGRVYNADLGEINLTFPKGGDRQQFGQSDLLNEDGQSGSSDFRFNGIRTSSVPTYEPGSSNKRLPERFNLLRFDDTRNKEQYLIRSQRRLDITALEKRYESISSDRHLTVGGIDPKTHMVGGSYFAKVFKDYNLHVGDPAALPKQSGNRNTKLENDDSLDVSGNVDQLIGGHWTVEVGSNPIAGPSQITLSALGLPGAVVLSGMTNITLMCGASSIVLTPAAIEIKSAAIILRGAVSGPVPVPPPPPVPLPPVPPLSAVPIIPNDPTPADPGDEPKPPKE